MVKVTNRCDMCGVVVGGGINVSIRLWTVSADDFSVRWFSQLVSIKDFLASVPFVFVNMRALTFVFVKPLTLFGP